jgi:hypothetical protein
MTGLAEKPDLCGFSLERGEKGPRRQNLLVKRESGH